MNSDEIKQQLVAHLERFGEMGVEHVDIKDQQQEIKHQNFSSLDELWSKSVDGCTACKLAGLGRTNIVFGEGNPNADLLFVGEGPGRDEDIQGKPFVGRAGQKLNDIIKAMGLSRDDVYIANIVKCRPPENRNPEPDEINTCIGYLNQQIDIIKPKVICSLGAISAHTLLNVKTPISKLRGHFHDYNGTPLMPTFHPAYLLRNYTPQTRKLVWEDMQQIMAKLEESK
jgi:uracil-DNA glycosylase family 4